MRVDVTTLSNEDLIKALRSGAMGGRKLTGPDVGLGRVTSPGKFVDPAITEEAARRLEAFAAGEPLGAVEPVYVHLVG